MKLVLIKVRGAEIFYSTYDGRRVGYVVKSSAREADLTKQEIEQFRRRPAEFLSEKGVSL